MNDDYYPSKIHWLKENGYKEISPTEYYHLLFPPGSFQIKDDFKGDYTPNGLLQYRNAGEDNNRMHCSIIYDDHSVIENCINRQGKFKNHEFVIISACSYIGRRKTNENSRLCFGITIDIDQVSEKGLENLLYLAEAKMIPVPTAIIISGNGIHVSYIFQKPIKLYKKQFKALSDIKALLTRKLWNANISNDPYVQYQGLVQGYRAVGTQTKRGYTVKAYLVGNKVLPDDLIKGIAELDDVEYLTSYKKQDKFSKRISKCISKETLEAEMQDLLCDDGRTMNELKEANPEWFQDWYERRVVQKQKPGHLHISRTLYDRWLCQIKKEAKQGNRKRCIYCLAAFAQKCDIAEEEFIKDAYSLVEPFDKLTINEDNPFTKNDVDDIIKQYRDKNLTHMTLKRVENITGFKYKTLSEEKTHIKGRPNIEKRIASYCSEHPNDSVTKIAQECNCSRTTVYKYFNTS